MSNKKQDTLLAAFGRQRQPPAKRQKLQLPSSELTAPRRKQRDVGDSEDDADASGSLTDADLFSSQEDGSDAALVAVEFEKRPHLVVETYVAVEHKTEALKDKLKLHERKEVGSLLYCYC
jgi:hypothetical protein